MNCGFSTTFSLMSMKAKIDEIYAALKYEESLYFPQTEKIASLELDLKCLQNLHATSETNLMREMIAYGVIGFSGVAFAVFAMLSLFLVYIEWDNAFWMMAKCKHLSKSAVKFFVFIFSLYCVVFRPPAVFLVYPYIVINAWTLCYVVINFIEWADGAIHRNYQSITGFVTRNYQNIMLSVIAFMMCVIALK